MKKAPLNHLWNWMFLSKACFIRICFTTENLSTRLSLIFLFTVSVVCTSCNSKITQEDYIKWVRDYDNNIHVKTSHADFIFDLQYQPTEYVLLQRGVENYGKDARIEELKKLSRIQYYTLIISTKDKIDLITYGTNTKAEKEEKQYYFSYRFQNEITLEENGQVLPCILYHAERPVTPNGGRTFVLGFENQNKNAVTSKLVIQSDLFSASPVKIEVTKSNIPPVDL